MQDSMRKMVDAALGRRGPGLPALLLVLAGTITAAVTQPFVREAPVKPAPSTLRSGASTAAQPVASGDGVHLDALGLQRKDPEGGARNLFRFGIADNASALDHAAAGSGMSPPSLSPTPPPPPVQTAVPGGPPPIALRLIGVVNSAQAGKVAVLTGARGVFYGRENEIIDGRHRIVRIDVESVELMFVDGRGRQTITLSGQ